MPTDKLQNLEINMAYSGAVERAVSYLDTGEKVADKELIIGLISDGVVISNITDSGNWTNDVYTGPAISVYEGQYYYDSLYKYEAKLDNSIVRLPVNAANYSLWELIETGVADEYYVTPKSIAPDVLRQIRIITDTTSDAGMYFNNTNSNGRASVFLEGAGTSSDLRGDGIWIARCGTTDVESNIKYRGNALVATDTILYLGGGNHIIFEVNGTVDDTAHMGDVLQIEQDGTLSSMVTAYETLVLADNDIPNRKFVLDSISFGEYILPIADTGILGGILDGTDLTIDASGNVSVTNGSNHSHNDIYYTETEVDTWRNSVSQTEMGYLAGIDSDIQDQLDGKQPLATYDAAIDTVNAEVIDVLTVTNGAVLSATKRTMTLAQLDYTGALNANYYVHPDSVVTDINTSGAAVVDIITTNVSGHVTNLTTRDLEGLWTKSGTYYYYNDGNVGINQATPLERLHVEGNIRANIHKVFAGTNYVGWVYGGYTSSSDNYVSLENNDADGGLRIYDTDGHAVFVDEVTADDFLLSSDRRLKTEIDYELKDVSIDGLKPTGFLLNGKFKYGFIAQDMLLTHPELVNGTGVEKEDGEIDYYSIKENSILAIVVKEVQELKNKNIILENRLLRIEKLLL